MCIQLVWRNELETSSEHRGMAFLSGKEHSTGIKYRTQVESQSENTQDK